MNIEKSTAGDSVMKHRKTIETLAKDYMQFLIIHGAFIAVCLWVKNLNFTMAILLLGFGNALRYFGRINRL